MAWANSREDLNLLEISYIKKFDSKNKLIGYNILDGGSFSGLANEKNPMYHKHHSKQAKEKISKANKGRFVGKKSYKYGTHLTEEEKEHLKLINTGKKRTPESIKKQSNKMKKEKNSNYCRKFSKEQREKIAECRLNTISDRIKVIQLDLNDNIIKIYDYLTEVENDGFSKGNVCSCCKGKLKTYKNFKWKYFDKSYKNRHNNVYLKNVPIVQLDINNKLIHTYKNSKYVKLSGYSNHLVILCCNNRNYTSDGFKWMYEKDFIKNIIKG